MKDEVKDLIRLVFGTEDFELVISELETVNLTHVMCNSQSQLDSVQLAIVKLSEGDLNKIGRYTDAAKIDCRDVLYWSSLYDRKSGK